MANIIEDFREVGHDIRRFAALGDHVVDARLLRNVLAHEIDHVIEGFDAVEGGPRFFRRAGRMGRNASEPEFCGAVSERRARLARSFHHPHANEV